MTVGLLQLLSMFNLVHGSSSAAAVVCVQLVHNV